MNFFRSQRLIRQISASLSLGFAVLITMAVQSDAQRLRTLIVGGGPKPDLNQVSIESNVRYVLRLLPMGAAAAVLFADGSKTAQTVLYEKVGKPLPEGERLLTLVLNGADAARPSEYRYRAPTVSRLDGPAKREDVLREFARLRVPAEGPILLYFTGHGSPAKNGNLDNNLMDLWGETLSVREVAEQVEQLPQAARVVLVMVQCYSGSFGNLLFEGGRPLGTPLDRDLVGFFATAKERFAAGCTPELNEKEYHDFTSYFFAALTGIDRVGRKVKGADYDNDGKVGMHEAFCYTLVNNPSIDVPVCTTDVLLRQNAPFPDSTVFEAQYGTVRSCATAAQRAALDGLSAGLGLTGEDRGGAAYRKYRFGDDGRQRSSRSREASRALSATRDRSKPFLIARWPDLLDASSTGHAAARKEAAAHIVRNRAEERYAELIEAEKKYLDAEKQSYLDELAEAKLVRFVRLFKTVVLTDLLRKSSDDAAKARFERLVAAEAKTLW